jgi:predicted LPLAT superfamily acyltransferase
MARPDPGPDASQSAAPPDWYSHGLNRLFYYRIAQAAASTLIWVKPGEEASALATTLAALERVIRAYPTQWFNFFDAWSPPHGHV